MTVTVEHAQSDTDTAPRAAQPAPGATDKKVDRLNTASLRRVIEPDTDVTGGVGDGQVIPSEMLTVTDLALGLSDRQQATLSREELASVAISGIRFETFLMSGFAAQMACSPDLTDPRIVYMLHEIGEETRHSRLFIRLVDQLQPKATDPLQTRLGQRAFRAVLRTVLNRPAVFCVLVLAGEEIPDLFQKKIADHPETDPFVRDVNHYHRMEEARHLAFARAVLPELWSEASFMDRVLIRFEVPRLIRLMFNGMVHPGVYRTIGLPAWKTWLDAVRSPSRVALRHEATRPILDALVDGGCFRAGSIPARWRRLCGVGSSGEAE
ncbi:MAG TPA: diiron oxygenase [Acidimicrobiales bacterium]|nr:diiron oxygenase [Acidimicrobiales bacterium]